MTDETRGTGGTATAPRPRMTYEEFLEGADEDTWAEWVDGEVVFMSPASTDHQRLVGFLTTVLDTWVRARGVGEVFPPPFQMKTGPTLPGREPDLVFVATSNLHRLRKALLEGPADLAIE